jgi:hypothetical protein
METTFEESMTAAVHDTDAIRARRRELFPPLDAPLEERPFEDRERFGTIRDHCGICPKPADEECRLVCSTERKNRRDGVTVT